MGVRVHIVIFGAGDTCMRTRMRERCKGRGRYDSDNEHEHDQKSPALSRTDRSPTHRPISTTLSTQNGARTMSSSDSSFSSSFFSSTFSSAAAAPPAAAPGAAAAAGAPPPAPTLERRSFTFLPSSAFARRDAQIASTSTPAAVVNALILSACPWVVSERVCRPDEVEWDGCNARAENVWVKAQARRQSNRRAGERGAE
ncbi:hypothetical protein EXIGLDRAFT_253326 [Exidia glandulosa HHB12029]|uniref:Uncharacterized protein n=1 Tax=Exidia glandulosa HHB12029 TaxID=1314781 RepID=A0A165DXH5_EXIGL|nr:hypothetical protein EXIGLDRAFT_253326 [Exidia glandulosa HHB12029]